MVEQQGFVKCMVFLRRRGEIRRQEGLGVHPFGRVPAAGEYVSLDAEGPHLQVTHVHHTGFGNHAAELYCCAAESSAADEFHPPAA